MYSPWILLEAPSFIYIFFLFISIRDGKVCTQSATFASGFVFGLRF